MKNDKKSKVSKKTVAAPAPYQAEQSSRTATQRNPGRPKGTKNTPKELRTPEHEARLEHQRKLRRVRVANAAAAAAVQPQARVEDPVEIDPAVARAIKAVAASAVPPPQEKGRLEGPVVIAGELHFSEKDQLLYTNRELGFQAGALSVQLQKMRIVQARQDMEQKLAAALADLKKLEAEANEKMQALHLFQGEVEVTYGVSFEHLSYDVQTGKILISGKPVSRTL